MPKGEVNLILQFSVQCLPPSTVHYFQHCKISAGEHKNESTHGKRLIPAKGLPDQHFWTSLCRGCWLSMATEESSGIEDSLRPWQSRRGNGVKHSAARTVKHLLFTTNTFSATVLTPDKLSEYPQNTGLGGSAADSSQIQARRMLQQMEAEIFWISSWGIISATKPLSLLLLSRTILQVHSQLLVQACRFLWES